MDYEFYVNQYKGTAIDIARWPYLPQRAADYLAELARQCRVEGSEHDRSMAVCALAETLDYYEAAQNGEGSLRYASIGSVSVSGKGIYGQLDISPKARERELYRCARRYLTVYRGLSEGGRPCAEEGACR